jgi:prolipoprotein diacylglyceryltransferase
VEFTLLGAALFAALAVYGVLWWEGRRGNALECTRDLWDVALGATLAGLGAGRLAAMVLDGTNPLTHLTDVLIIRGGVDTAAASLAALATLGILGRRDLWRTLDGLGPAAQAGLAAWHAGCTMRGACLGTPSDLPWAMAQGGSPVTRHPVEIYAALLLAAGAVVLLLWKRYRRPGDGVVGAIALAAAGGVRLLTEPLRPGLGSGPAPWYIAGVAVGVAVAVWRWRAGRRVSA